jgi:hypothetical protein
VSAGASETKFFATVPDGVRASWVSATERSYFEGVRDPASPVASDRQVETARRTVEGGLRFDAICARLPGLGFRIDGNLEVSSFVGTGLDRAVVTFPIQLDGPRHEWVRTVVVCGRDASADVAFRQFGAELAGSGDFIELLVRVD